MRVRTRYISTALHSPNSAIRQNYYNAEIRSTLAFVRARRKKCQKIDRATFDDGFLKNRDLVRLEKLARYSRMVTPSNNAAALLLTICNRRGAILHVFYFFFFCTRNAQERPRDLATRRPERDIVVRSRH